MTAKVEVYKEYLSWRMTTYGTRTLDEEETKEFTKEGLEELREWCIAQGWLWHPIANKNRIYIGKKGSK